MSHDALSETLSYVISLYELSAVQGVQPITEGLIHQTYALSLTDGLTLILQRLHPLLNTEDTLEDFEAVTKHLASEGYGGPQLLYTKRGERAATDLTGGKWRLSTFVPGVTLSSIEDVHQASLAGEALATFHTLMSKMQYRFKSPHPGHDTRGHWERLRGASEAPEHREPWAQIQSRAAQILEALEGLILPLELPKVIVHGDPKITNLRFQEGRAVLIDLDTCASHTRLVDIGDAIRSWCDLSREGAVPVDGRVFAVERCQAMLRAYIRVSGPLSELEQAWLPRCGRTITLELASRFARDYLEDHYFGFDAQRFGSRRAHNLHRMEAMWRLAEEMREAEEHLTL